MQTKINLIIRKYLLGKLRSNQLTLLFGLKKAHMADVCQLKKTAILTHFSHFSGGFDRHQSIFTAGYQ